MPCLVFVREAERDESRPYGWRVATRLMTRKCKKTVTKTVDKNASISVKNRDEMMVFTLACGRFSLFWRSKLRFYVAKAMLLHAESSPFALSKLCFERVKGLLWGGFSSVLGRF